MLHAKFHKNWSNGSGEIFERVFTICGRGGHHGHMTSIMLINFHFLLPKILHANVSENRPFSLIPIEKSKLPY